jgi:hypothetical protein
MKALLTLLTTCCLSYASYCQDIQPQEKEPKQTFDFVAASKARQYNPPKVAEPAQLLRQVNTANTTMLLSIVGTIAGVIITREENNNGMSPSTGPAIIAIGTTATTIGLIWQLTASKHLHRHYLNNGK